MAAITMEDRAAMMTTISEAILYYRLEHRAQIWSWYNIHERAIRRQHKSCWRRSFVLFPRSSMVTFVSCSRRWLTVADSSFV